MDFCLFLICALDEYRAVGREPRAVCGQLRGLGDVARGHLVIRCAV